MLRHDLRYALRVLTGSPGFTAVAVLTLALGIGTTTAIFSVVDAVLLEKLPFVDSDRLVRVFSDTPTEGVDRYFINEGDLTDWRERNRSFEQIAAFWPTEFNVTTRGGEPERVGAATATANLFPMLGMSPIHGRGFTKEEDSPGGPTAVMITHGYWQRRFGGNLDILGQQIELQSNPYTIVGILPNELRLLAAADVWIPQPIRTNVRGGRYLDGIGKLKEGIPLEQAHSDLMSIAGQTAEEIPIWNKGWTVDTVLLGDELLGESRTALLILMGAVGLMLLIACANVANLQLARAEARQREFAVRTALGANAWRLASQLLIESLVLAVVAGAVGLILAYLSVTVAPGLGPDNVPRLDEIAIDIRVLGFALVTSLFTGILFGLAPLLRIRRARLDVQSSGSRGVSSGRSSRRARSLLVVSEIALAIILINGAGLLLQSFSRLLAVSPGFQAENVVTADIGLAINKYQKPQQVADFYTRLIEDLGAEPGVRVVGATTSLPMRKDVDFRLNFGIKDRPTPENPEEQSAFYRMVTVGYFKAIGTPLISGRDFHRDDDAEAPGVVLVNETMARRYWPDESPIGKNLRVHVGAFGPAGNTLARDPEIIGIVADIRQTGLEAPPEPAIYFPHKQAPFRQMTTVVRTTAKPSIFAEAIRRTAQSIDSSLPISNVSTLEETLSEAVAQPRFRTLLLGVFAGLALLLASVGVYGVTSYTVSQRSREIVVRVAMGARPPHVVSMLGLQVLGMVGGGVFLGSIAALAGGRLLTGLLFDVEVPDWPTLLGVPVLFTAVALVASVAPAFRALRVDPVEVLRYE